MSSTSSSRPTFHRVQHSAEHLLSDDEVALSPISSPQDRPKSPALAETAVNPEAIPQHGNSATEAELPRRPSNSHYRTYKRRWFGLFQLALLNIIVSWDWLTFAAVSGTASQYYGVSEVAINWLSTGFLFAFVVISPATIWVLNRGPKQAIIVAAVFTLIGNWIRYGGTRSSPPQYGVVMFGQIVIGLAQPFVLAAPTRYSDLWFTERGRISATALASLANPLGGALGQLIGPEWAKKPSDIPNMVLYVAIISSVASIPSFFIPGMPPTPVSASSSVPKTPLSKTFRALFRNPSFYLILIPFSMNVGFFNALSSLLNQVLGPYGFSEDQAGISGGLLIVVGLVSSAICSPIVSYTKSSLLAIKLLSPIIGLSYALFTLAPTTRTVAAPYAISALLGASSFALVPVALEYLVDVTFPASPEVASTIAWTGGQLFGGIFIVIMGALKDDDAVTGSPDRPPGNMRRALIFQAVLACLVVPLPLCLGVRALGLSPAKKRDEVEDSHAEATLPG